ncbi:helix-turn-helix domain-containing protein [Eubacteriales bacterium OttesenSCG-928-N13]|nr:helix-turn-helix domain-containing protein [Eubacteriales bacterium OttesenSCG-928-N13]
MARIKIDPAALRQRRAQRGYSMRTLASRAGVSKSAIRAWEGSDCGIQEMRLLRLAAALGIEPQALAPEYEGMQIDAGDLELDHQQLIDQVAELMGAIRRAQREGRPQSEIERLQARHREKRLQLCIQYERAEIIEAPQIGG